MTMTDQTPPTNPSQPPPEGQEAQDADYYDDKYRPQPAPDGSTGPDAGTSDPGYGTNQFAADDDSWYGDDKPGWMVRDDKTGAVLAGPFDSEMAAADHLRQELTAPGSTGQPLEGSGDYSVHPDDGADLETIGPWVASRVADGGAPEGDEAVDWLLRLRELQAEGMPFDEALAVANDEVDRSTSKVSALYDAKIGDRVLVDFLSHLEEGTVTSQNADGKLEITFEDGQVNWYWPDEVTTYNPREASARAASEDHHRGYELGYAAGAEGLEFDPPESDSAEFSIGYAEGYRDGTTEAQAPEWDPNEASRHTAKQFTKGDQFRITAEGAGLSRVKLLGGSSLTTVMQPLHVGDIIVFDYWGRQPGANAAYFNCPSQNITGYFEPNSYGSPRMNGLAEPVSGTYGHRTTTIGTSKNGAACPRCGEGLEKSPIGFADDDLPNDDDIVTCSACGWRGWGDEASPGHEAANRTAGLAWYDDSDETGVVWAADIGSTLTAFVYGPTAESPGWGWDVQDANGMMPKAEGDGADLEDCKNQVEQWVRTGRTGSVRTATNWMLDGTPIEGGFEVEGDVVGEDAADWRDNPSEGVWESGGMTEDGMDIRPVGIWPSAWSEHLEDVESPAYVDQVAPFLRHPEQI